MEYVIIENGPRRGKAFPLPMGKKLLLGRDPSVPIYVPDQLVSRRHCRLEAFDGVFSVRDLKSSNGTFLNGVRVTESRLEVGDRIQIGETILSFMGEARGEGLTGRTVGGYRILDRVGRGGMGTVFKARQLSLDRVVALKILSKELIRDPSFIDLFVREARAAGQLSHPNIVQVYDVGREDDFHFFSMEYMARGSVEDRLNREGRLPALDTLRIARDALRGLEYSERKGIVHRDIKPGNLMIDADSSIKIGDLGIAKRSEGGLVSQKEGISGSPHYIAPEQARGLDIDHRVDIYSLGASLYQMLAGRTPFTGSTPREIIIKQVRELPEPLPSIAPDVPHDLCQVVDRMMAKDREQRYASAAEIIPAVERLIRDEEGGARRIGRPRRRRVSPGRRGGIAVVIVALLAIGAGAAIYAFVHNQRIVAARNRAVEIRAQEIRSRIDRGEYDSAIGALEDLEREYPEAQGKTATLWADARRGRDRLRMEERNRVALAEIEKARRAVSEKPKDFDEHIKRFRAIARDFGDTDAVQEALKEIEELRDAKNRYEHLVSQGMADFVRSKRVADGLLGAENFKAATQEWLRFPDRYLETPVWADREKELERIRALEIAYATSRVALAVEKVEADRPDEALSDLEDGRKAIGGPGAVKILDDGVQRVRALIEARREAEARRLAAEDEARWKTATEGLVTMLRELDLARAIERVKLAGSILVTDEYRKRHKEDLEDLHLVARYVEKVFSHRPADLVEVRIGPEGEREYIHVAGIEAEWISYSRSNETIPQRRRLTVFDAPTLIHVLSVFFPLRTAEDDLALAILALELGHAAGADPLLKDALAKDPGMAQRITALRSRITP